MGVFVSIILFVSVILFALAWRLMGRKKEITVASERVVIDTTWKHLVSYFPKEKYFLASKKFLLLTPYEQEFCITNLLHQNKNGQDLLKADIDTLADMMKKYPDLTKRFWYNVFLSTLEAGYERIDERLKRARNLFDHVIKNEH